MKINIALWCYRIIASLASLVILWAMWSQIQLVIISLVLAFMINPIADRFESFKISRATTFLVIVSITGLISWWAIQVLVPLAKEQWATLYAERDQYQKIYEQRLALGKEFAERLFGSTQVQLWFDQTTTWMKNYFHELQTHLPQYLSSMLAFLGTAIFSPIFAFFLVTDGQKIKKYIYGIIPNRHFDMILHLQYNFQKQLGAYMRGQILDCLAVGILIGIGLSLLNVKGAWIIALFAGCANAIPYLGPILGAIPAILVLLMDPQAASPWWSPILLFAFIKLIDDILIYPQTVGKSLNLHPFVVLFAILAGESLGGILGMLIAVPSVAIASQSLSILHHSLKRHRFIS